MSCLPSPCSLHTHHVLGRVDEFFHMKHFCHSLPPLLRSRLPVSRALARRAVVRSLLIKTPLRPRDTPVTLTATAWFGRVERQSSRRLPSPFNSIAWCDQPLNAGEHNARARQQLHLQLMDQ